MKKKQFIGIDVGGTKISGALVSHQGTIIDRRKKSTPKNAGHKEVLSTIDALLKELLPNKKAIRTTIAGIGVGIPGIVNSTTGTIIRTPNINLSGLSLAKALGKKYCIPVAVDNDVNVGLLGEQWRGAAQNASTVIGIFPGTGVGGAFIINDQLISSPSGAAAELGHMIMDPNGPKCSCGNRGCLEAFSSRWALERDIRDAIKKGKKTIIPKLTNNRSKRIKSKIIREALKKRDKVVTKLVTDAAVMLGLACINFRHIFDPERIVFGGGLIEACSKYILPTVRKVVNKDPFFRDIPKCEIVAAQLGDDAVLLGAVALVKRRGNHTS